MYNNKYIRNNIISLRLLHGMSKTELAKKVIESKRLDKNKIKYLMKIIKLTEHRIIEFSDFIDEEFEELHDYGESQDE